MSRVIVIEFMSLDGVMQDPDGNEGTPHGGWAFRFGPGPVTGDPFGLSEVLDTGALLLGRQTWQMFAKIWPGRDDPFSAKMNAMPKLVASRSLDQADGWQNSAVLPGDLAAAVRERKRAQDIVVMGSASVVHALMAEDLVDEYRLIVFPEVLGEGERVFPGGTAPADPGPGLGRGHRPDRPARLHPSGQPVTPPRKAAARREDRNAGRSSRPGQRARTPAVAPIPTHPHLRHYATRHIVSMYRFDI